MQHCCVAYLSWCQFPVFMQSKNQMIDHSDLHKAEQGNKLFRPATDSETFELESRVQVSVEAQPRTLSFCQPLMLNCEASGGEASLSSAA